MNAFLFLFNIAFMVYWFHTPTPAWAILSCVACGFAFPGLIKEVHRAWTASA